MVSNITLDITFSTKYLSLKIDCISLVGENISFKSKVTLGALKRCSQLAKHTAHFVYDAHLMAKIRYGHLAWSHTTDHNIMKINISMSKSLKTIYKLHWRTPTKQVYEFAEK